jgi:hypothetical protein
MTSNGNALEYRDLAGAHARLDRVEKRLREADFDGLRVAAVDSAAGATANGLRDLAATSELRHVALMRQLERVQALVLGLVAEVAARVGGDLSPERAGLIGVLVIVLAGGSPEIARHVVDRLAKAKGAK